ATAATAATAARGEIEVRARAVLGRLLALRPRVRGFRALRALLEEGILRDRLVQFLHAFQSGKLQQFHRLLQPRCQRELLLQAQSQYGIGHSRNPLSQISTTPPSAAQQRSLDAKRAAGGELATACKNAMRAEPWLNLPSSDMTSIHDDEPGSRSDAAR